MSEWVRIAVHAATSKKNPKLAVVMLDSFGLS